MRNIPSVILDQAGAELGCCSQELEPHLEVLLRILARYQNIGLKCDRTRIQLVIAAVDLEFMTMEFEPKLCPDGSIFVGLSLTESGEYLAHNFVSGMYD